MISRVMFLAAVAVSACYAADLYPVAGTVLNTTTNSPLPRARVYFFLSSDAKPVVSTTTGDDGRFRFQLPAGSYRMLAGTRDVLEKYGSRHPGDSLASSVIVGPGKDTASLVFRFSVPGAISGRILDNSGEPVTNASIDLIRSIVTEGRRYTTVFALERTDDLGEYRFGGLPGDTSYYLTATGQPWYAQAQGAGNPGTQAASTYAPVYYPDTPDESKAAPILLRPGQEARADFSLTQTVTARVTVRYSAPPGMRGVVALNREGLAGNPVVQQTQQFNTPARSGLPQESTSQIQTLAGIPPGHYTAMASGFVGSSVFQAEAPVDVNGSDLTVDLTLKPHPTIEGSVHLPPGATPKSAILLLTGPEGIAGSFPIPVRGDGSFSFPSAPSRIHVALGGSDGFYATRIEARGGTFKDGVLEVSEGSDVTLSITASNETGELRGAVIDRDRPADGVLVILAPAPGQDSNIERPRAFQTESDGSFDFRAVPVGRYRLFAVDDAEIEYTRPEALAPYLSQAKEIEIRSRTSIDEKISLTLPSAR